jgi:uncharacterized membrane protein YedE/YeeE
MAVFMERCPWLLGGVLLGLVVIGLQWLGNLPLGMTGAFASWLEWKKMPSKGIPWRVFFFSGGAIGAFTYSRLVGFQPTFEMGSFDRLIGSSIATKAWVLTFAGVFIGFGTRLSGGCTSGHGLCGMSRSSPSGFAATATFFSVAAIVAQVLIYFGGR